MKQIPKLIIPKLPYSDERIIEVFEQNQLVTGSYVKLFEAELAREFNFQHASTTSSGFAALFLAIKSLNFKNAKVVVPLVSTCQSITNAVIANGLDVIFCNLDPKSLSLDINELNLIYKKSKFDLIIAPSHFGIPAPIESLRSYGVPIIEDACQSFFTRTKIHSSADFLILSFYPTKGFNCIEGGAILLNSSSFFQKIEDIKYYSHQVNFDNIPRYNFRMINLNAAFGYIQFEQIDKEIDRLLLIRNKYFQKILNKKIMVSAQFEENVVPWRLLLRKIDKNASDYITQSGIKIDKELVLLNSANNHQTVDNEYQHFRSIPFYSDISDKDQKFIIECLNQCLYPTD